MSPQMELFAPTPTPYNIKSAPFDVQFRYHFSTLWENGFTMRNRDHNRENVENILAVCLPILTMQHIREPSSASHAMRRGAWNARLQRDSFLTGLNCMNMMNVMINFFLSTDVNVSS